jgi:hypothetical protein
VSFSGGGKERAQFSEIKTERRDVTVNSVLAGFHQQKKRKEAKSNIVSAEKDGLYRKTWRSCLFRLAG